jgi:tetratricopeptide (TPR) repeat protein
VFILFHNSEGNNFFKAKNYREAIAKYTEAIQADPTDVTFFSNRRYEWITFYFYFSISTHRSIGSCIA